MRLSNSPKSILITGASSGIGEALAKYYATEGRYLFLTGRNIERLEAVAKACRHLKAQVSVAVMDVKDTEAMRRWINACYHVVPLDLVIANAGISNSGHVTTEELDREIFATNINGVLNTVYPAMHLMQEHHRGQIAIISSLASLHGFARAAAYCASKAALTAFGQALRSRLKKYHIKVSVVCPGFIATPLIANSLHFQPCILSKEKAAQIIAKGLSQNKGLIAFPRRLYFLLWFLRLLPVKMTEWITSLL